MTNYCFKRNYCTLLLLFISFNFCNAQVNKSGNQGSQQPAVGRAKLFKTQGSDQYQNISCGLQDKAGNLWFGTSAEGVYRYDGKLFTQFTKADGLTCNSVRSILEDKNGNIWLGTRDGLCRFDGKKIIPFPILKSFMPFTNTSDDYYTAQSTKETVWSMFQDKSGKIWFGTGDGVYWFDGNNFNRFLENTAVINKGGLTLRMVTSILQDKNGLIWFASGMPPGEEGIIRYDGKTLENFKPMNESWFRKIIEDKNRNLIFATRKHGVLFCDLSTKKFSEASFVKYPQPKELLNGSLTTIVKDKAGEIWMASDYGKYVGDTLGGAWLYKSTPAAGENVFSKITTREVFFMLQDKDNNFWFGTRGTGLYRYDGKNLTSFSE